MTRKCKKCKGIGEIGTIDMSPYLRNLKRLDWYDETSTGGNVYDTSSNFEPILVKRICLQCLGKGQIFKPIREIRIRKKVENK